MSLDAVLKRIDGEGTIPPLERWQPTLSGDMDLLIRGDGVWVHEGEPITRTRLVRLLSTILRREDDGDYYLVSPVEKWRIRVDDKPFLIVAADVLELTEPMGANEWWQLTTNVGDRLILDASHRLHVSDTPHGEPVPEVAVRFGLSARFNRNVYYRMIEQAEQRSDATGIGLGVVSGGVWQPLGHLDEGAL